MTAPDDKRPRLPCRHKPRFASKRDAQIARNGAGDYRGAIVVHDCKHCDGWHTAAKKLPAHKRGHGGDWS